MLRTIEIDLEFQQTIPTPPVEPRALYKEACGNDDVTLSTWRDIWLDNTAKNHKKYGPFKNASVGSIQGLAKNQPVIIVGSGPSLAVNVDRLKDTKGIKVLSCLHNYHYLEDRGVKPDFYVSLDAGAVTLEEVSEGGTKTAEEYYASTKDKTLIAFIGSHPSLLEKWQGKILWYNAPIPDKSIIEAIDAIEKFHTFVSTGGNVLGACFYIAKGIMGANPIIFTGADFAFSYTKKFHPWNSKYDKTLGAYIRAVDVFGNSVCTWPSYMNFSKWFVSRCCSVPGMYINATEGGVLGAFPQGNIEQIKQMALSEVLEMYALSDVVKESCINPEIDDRIILF